MCYNFSSFFTPPMLTSITAYQGETLNLSSENLQLLVDQLRRDIEHGALIRELLTKPHPLQKDVIQNFLLLKEAFLADFGRITGIELETQEQRNERYGALKAANIRIRELERQIGNAADSEQTRAHLRLMGDKVRAWWRQYGLGGVVDITFTEGGCVILKLGCTTFSLREWVHPVTGEKYTGKDARLPWMSYLAEQGLSILEGDNTHFAPDTDQNRRSILAIIKKAMPSSSMQKIEASFERDGTARMDDLTLYVREFSDISNLPKFP